MQQYQINDDESSFLHNLQQIAGDYAYNRWLSHLKFSHIDGSIAVLYVETKLIRDFIISNYFNYVLQVVKDHNSNIQRVDILLDKSASKELRVDAANKNKEEISRQKSGNVNFDTKYILNRKKESETFEIDLKQFSRTNEMLTFDNFIQGAANRMPYLACKKIAIKTIESVRQNNSNQQCTMLDGASDLQADAYQSKCVDQGASDHFHSDKINNAANTKGNAFYNENIIGNHIKGLCIYGAPGIGKTHLLHAVVNEVKCSNIRANIGYFTAERFTHCYVSAVRNNAVIQFKDALSKLDILILDDLQFICGRSSTEKEFITIFDHMLDANKFVITSSDVHPNSLKLDERSKSRLASCITVKIDMLDVDLRLEILKSKLSLLQAFSSSASRIDDSILEEFAKNVCGNARELEGALYKLITYADLMGAEISKDMVQRVLIETSNTQFGSRYDKKNGESALCNGAISCQQMLNLICLELGVHAKDIVSTNRSKHISIARQIVAYVMRQHHFKLDVIGDALGNRNHATISYLISTFKSKESEYAMDLLKINNRLAASRAAA